MNAADGKLRAARLDGEPSAAPAHTPEPEVGPWEVVQNGAQVDVCVRVLPEGEAPRVKTIAANVRPQDAARMVAVYNAAVERERLYAEHVAEIDNGPRETRFERYKAGHEDRRRADERLRRAVVGDIRAEVRHGMPKGPTPAEVFAAESVQIAPPLAGVSDPAAVRALVEAARAVLDEFAPKAVRASSRAKAEDLRAALAAFPDGAK